MSNSNETNSADSSGINTKWILIGLGVISFVIFGLYLFNFHYGFSIENADWGTFGDYFAGILNPVIAAFALYLIVEFTETYKLQKRELKLSTNALNDQVKLAALTALLNSNLTRISLLKNENLEILKENGRKSTEAPQSGSNDLEENFLSGFDEAYEKEIRKNLAIINELTGKNKGFESQIETLCNQFN